MAVVSVIIPSYNHAGYVGQAIDSVLSQTLTDIELIVIDDGSTDGTQDVLRRYADPRLRIVLRDRNVGSAEGSNDGLRMARAPFVAMLSSDDFFSPHKLATQLQVLRDEPRVTAVFCRPRIVDEAGGDCVPNASHWGSLFAAGRWDRTQLLRRLFHSGNFLCHPSVLVRRDAYHRAGPYDARLSSLGDFDMWMRIAVADDGDFVVLDEPLVSFRVHTGNTSAPTAKNLRCCEHEWPLIADRLRGLRQHSHVVAAAFPEVSDSLRGDPMDVDYALCRLAIGHPVRSVRANGLRRLYELMADEAAAARLATAHDFCTRDLIALSQETDTSGVIIAPSAEPPPAVVHDAAPAAVPNRPATSTRPPLLRRVARETARVVRQVRSLAAATAHAERPAEPRLRQKPGYTRISREAMSEREAAAVAGRYLEERARAGGPRGLHLGCGDHPFDEWLNVDLGGQPDIVWDLTQPFAWAPTGTFDLCYSEHVLEHFSRPAGIAILREACRCLRPGGIVRIAVPDLANVVRMYVDDSFLDSPHAERDVLAPTASEAGVLFGGSYGTKGERLNVAMYGWGHAYLYDEGDLVRALVEAGFSRAERRRHALSSHAGLSGLETRPEPQSALFVEGTKT